jgi:hypothetical protein
VNRWSYGMRTWGPLLVTALSVLLAVGSCADEESLRGAGACTLEQCAANLCFDSSCIAAPPSEDDDYLTREQEARLGTVSSNPDTDRDGWLDGLEIVAVDAPRDEDGDGVNDASESAESDADGDCLVDQKDPDDAVAETDPQRLAELGCCCYGPCSAWDIEVGEASCELGEDGEPELVCPEALQLDSDGDGRADVCDLCPDDPSDDCEWAPHGLYSDPASPNRSMTPTISGHAFWAQSVNLYALECGEEVMVAEAIPVDPQGRFSVPVTVAETATTTFVARAHRIGGLVSGTSEPLLYTHLEARPLLELQGDDAWRSVVITGDSKVRLRVTTEAIGDEWFLFPTPNCVAQSISWSAPMWDSTQDEMVLTNGHINLGSNGTETVFTTRVRYADGSESPCSDAAVYVRQSATPAVAAWLVNPEDPSQAATREALTHRSPSATVRVAMSADVVQVTLFDGSECAGQPRLTEAVSEGAGALLVDLTSPLEASTDSVTTFELSAQGADGEGDLSECLSGLSYLYDPVPPPLPDVSLTVPPDAGAGVLFSGQASDAARLIVFAGPACATCLDTRVHELDEAAEASGAFEFSWAEAPAAESYSAYSRDAAGNESACVEVQAP